VPQIQIDGIALAPVKLAVEPARAVVGQGNAPGMIRPFGIAVLHRAEQQTGRDYAVIGADLLFFVTKATGEQIWLFGVFLKRTADFIGE
jgi:hypothetical protein